MSSTMEQGDAAAAAVSKAPRISLQDIEGKIVARYDTTGDQAVKSINGEATPELSALQKLSICVLVLQNGFVLIGKSAPASVENFDPALGIKFAYEDAIRQIWPLEGYTLATKLAGFEDTGSVKTPMPQHA